MGFEVREIRRRLKRRLRNRQSVSRYCQRLGLIHGITTYWRLVTYKTRVVPIIVPLLPTPVLVRPDTTDPFIFEEVFLLDEYDFTTTHDPKLIMDIGANVGYASVYFAQRYPRALIIAVEPETSNIEWLRKNTGSFPNVKVVEAGIWSRRARLALVDADAKSSDFQLRECSADEDGIEAVTVDELFELAQSNHADIIKIDIEGGEKELFAENTDWLDKVDTIAIELHDRFKAGCKETFLQATSRYGFSGQEIGLNYIARRQTREEHSTN
jgi:FkbM family methyltransferase